MIQYQTMNPYSLESSNAVVDYLSKQPTLVEGTISPPRNDFPNRAVRRKTESSIIQPSTFSSIFSSSPMKVGSAGSQDGLKRRTLSANNFRYNSSFPSNRGSTVSNGSSSSLRLYPRNDASTTVHGPLSVSTKNWSGNAVMQVAQRSNASTVKSVIAELHKVCNDASSSSEIEPPVQICSMIAQWASVDVYYKVVIVKYNGVQATVRAMAAFPSCADLQSTCCTILANLVNSKDLVVSEGGVRAILKAMQEHPTSTIVQSAALEALRPFIPSLVQEQAILDEIRDLLKRGKDVYLTKAGTKAAMDIQSFLENIPYP